MTNDQPEFDKIIGRFAAAPTPMSCRVRTPRLEAMASTLAATPANGSIVRVRSFVAGRRGRGRQPHRDGRDRGGGRGNPASGSATLRPTPSRHRPTPRSHGRPPIQPDDAHRPWSTTDHESPRPVRRGNHGATVSSIASDPPAPARRRSSRDPRSRTTHGPRCRAAGRRSGDRVRRDAVRRRQPRRHRQLDRQGDPARPRPRRRRQRSRPLIVRQGRHDR